MECTLSELERFNYLHDEDFKDLPRYKMKTRYFLNKTVDFVVTRCDLKRLITEPFYGTMTTHQRTLTDEELERKRLENIQRAARRARQKVHFLTRQIGADHMLTLTARENITDKIEFDRIFQEFIRLVRNKRLNGHGDLVSSDEKNVWAYVAVREMQDRGAYHFHIACVGRQNIPFLRACWYVALGGSEHDQGEATKGQVDVQFAQRRFSGQTETHKTFALVNYLCKYISKEFESNPELGQRRYKSSRGIPAPIVHKQFLPVYFSNGESEFVEAMKHALTIAKFIGVNQQSLVPWNRDLDIFILRGDLS